MIENSGLGFVTLWKAISSHMDRIWVEMPNKKENTAYKGKPKCGRLCGTKVNYWHVFWESSVSFFVIYMGKKNMKN